MFLLDSIVNAGRRRETDETSQSSKSEDDYQYSIDEITRQIDIVKGFLENPTAQLCVTRYFDTEAIELGILRRDEMYRESYLDSPFGEFIHNEVFDRTGLPASSAMNDWETHPRSLVDIFSTAKIAMNLVLTVSLFSQFVQSRTCRDWMGKRKKNVEHVCQTLDLLRGSVPRSPSSFTSPVLEAAYASLDLPEVDMFRRSKFLSSFLAAVETLPICFTIASASPDRRGFPLIYVNKVFEDITLYSRSEVVGRNCRFLQRDYDQPDRIAHMGACLRDAMPVRMELINFRKNGSRFLNHLSMKPIFDRHGVYQYVFGVQADLSFAAACEPMIKFIDQLLEMIPERLPAEEQSFPELLLTSFQELPGTPQSRDSLPSRHEVWKE
jgi:PAS domain S-box-containing protein